MGNKLPRKLRQFPRATGALRKEMDLYTQRRITATELAEGLLEMVDAYQPPSNARTTAITYLENCDFENREVGVVDEKYEYDSDSRKCNRGYYR